ncbi:MAG: PKD domain-containing protein [Desulfoarculaceae bacterium]|nr:PKD domain-containing protein [Desulfoarculaceae bacterium]
MVTVRKLFFCLLCLSLFTLQACGGGGEDSTTNEAVNAAPVANAGPDQNVATGSMITLNGSGSSDADGDLLTYAWDFSSIPSGSTATLSDSTSAKPTYTADLDGTYVLSLIVNDGTADSAADTVTVTATIVNAVPVANAGPDQNVATGSMITLNGSGSSDADGDLLTYAWDFSSIPSGSTATLSDSTIAKPTYTADLDGTYVLSLIVNDGTADSAADTVTVTATTVNAVPVANAGPDQNVTTGSMITLNGSGSSDADGDLLTYAWDFSSIPSGSTATLSDSTSAKPTYTADFDGTYVLSLIVNDGTTDSAADTVTVTATIVNAVPVANAGPDQNVTTGSMITLNGIGSSDADGDLLTYKWRFSSIPSGSTATLSDSTIATPTYTADLDGTYVLSLIVNDGMADSTADTVSINSYSNYSLLFSTSASSSVVSINSYIQPGSQFFGSITNNSSSSFVCYRAELLSGTDLVGYTEDPSLLGGDDQMIPGESIGIAFTLNRVVYDNGFNFIFYLRRPETGETFTVGSSTVTGPLPPLF